MLKDIYFSQSAHDHEMDETNWFYKEDAYMPVIKIDSKYIPFSEQIRHGMKPLMRRDDLKLIATLKDEDMDITIVKRIDY